MKKTVEYAIINHDIDNAMMHNEDVLFTAQEPSEIISKLRDCGCTDDNSTVEIYYVDEDGDFLEGSDYDTPSNFIKRFSESEDAPRTWYAILTDEEDNDWGTGSFDFEEAKSRCREYGPDARIAVINDGPDPICERIILQEDF